MDYKRKFTRIALSVALLLAVSVGSASAIAVLPTVDLRPSVGVRATGMGGAYTAIASDVTALVYNPAGIGQKFIDVTVGVSSPDPEAASDIGMFIAENPTNIDLSVVTQSVNLTGIGGASLGPLAVAAIINSDLKDLGTDTWEATIKNEIIGGLGFRVARVPLGAGELRLGVAAHALDMSRFYYQVVDGEVVTSGEQTGKGFRLSAGAMATITPWVSLGVTAQNLAGQIEWSDDDTPEDIYYTDKLEPVFTGGIAVKVPFLGITLAADADDQNNIRYGAEANLLFNLLSLRVGQKQSPNTDTVTTAGLSMNLGPMSAGFAAETRDLEQKTLDRVLAEASIRF